jgi:hypothetical protein
MRKCKHISSGETFYFELGIWRVQHVDYEVYKLYLTNDNQNPIYTKIVDMDDFDEYYVDIQKLRKLKLEKLHASNM